MELDIRNLARKLKERSVDIVALDGCGGSGKSTLARRLAARLPRAVVLRMDDFYRSVVERKNPPPVPGYNFDRERLVRQVLAPRRENRDGRYQRYDWDGDKLAEWHDVVAGSVVVLEGVYSTSAALHGSFDYSIWVEASYPTRLARGVARDGERMRSTWVNEWMPAEDEYVEAEGAPDRADFIVSGEDIQTSER